jgi:methionine synthase I (cobalamin-dependent)
MIQDVSKKIIDMKQEMSEIEIGLVQTGVDVGPAIFVAKVFRTDVDTVVTWLIFVFIFVFDPLAVVLTIGFNIALGTREIEMYIKEEEEEETKSVEIEPDPEDIPKIEEKSDVHVPSSYDIVEKVKSILTKGKDGHRID